MPFYQPQIPRLCTNAFKFFSSWWSTSFTYKVLTLLETAGLCVLVFACPLYCIERRVFESIDCYGIVYDTGSSLCSCIASFLPSSCQPYHNYPSRPRHRSWRRNWNPSRRCRPLDKGRNPSGITNQRGRNRYFQTKMVQEQSMHERVRILVSKWETNIWSKFIIKFTISRFKGSALAGAPSIPLPQVLYQAVLSSSCKILVLETTTSLTMERMFLWPRWLGLCQRLDSYWHYKWHRPFILWWVLWHRWW